MKEKLTNELITALLEVMNIPKSGYIEASLREKLEPLNPKHYTEVMKNLMDNQDKYAKPIEKISVSIQKSLDKYYLPDTIDGLMSYLNRSYKGRVISDHVEGVFKDGVKIALSVDGKNFVNLYNGSVVSDSDTVKVLDWLKNNPRSIGIINGNEYDHTKVIPIFKEEEKYIDEQIKIPILENISNKKRV